MLDCLLCFVQVVLPEVVSPRFLMYGLTHLYIFYAIPVWVLVLLHLSWFFIGALVGDDMLGFFFWVVLLYRRPLFDQFSHALI